MVPRQVGRTIKKEFKVIICASFLEHFLDKKKTKKKTLIFFLFSLKIFKKNSCHVIIKSLMSNSLTLISAMIHDEIIKRKEMNTCKMKRIKEYDPCCEENIKEFYNP